MKLGIFSDIHGNIYAFRPVIRQLLAHECDRYVFCGDLCGYYYFQNEVVEMLSALKPLHAVLGNHDKMFLELLHTRDEQRLAKYTATYGRSISALRKDISPATLAFLESLPEQWLSGEENLAVFHGNPWDPIDSYVYPSDDLSRFAGLPYRFILLGHTHYPMDRKIAEVRVINPGSCGQPRNARPPSYAILDTSDSQVEFHYVKYDQKPLLNDIRKRDETLSYLSEVLLR